MIIWLNLFLNSLPCCFWFPHHMFSNFNVFMHFTFPILVSFSCLYFKNLFIFPNIFYFYSYSSIISLSTSLSLPPFWFHSIFHFRYFSKNIKWCQIFFNHLTTFDKILQSAKKMTIEGCVKRYLNSLTIVNLLIERNLIISNKLNS